MFYHVSINMIHQKVRISTLIIHMLSDCPVLGVQKKIWPFNVQYRNFGWKKTHNEFLTLRKCFLFQFYIWTEKKIFYDSGALSIKFHFPRMYALRTFLADDLDQQHYHWMKCVHYIGFIRFSRLLPAAKANTSIDYCQD